MAVAQKRRTTRGASRQNRSTEPQRSSLNSYLAGVASGLFLAFLLYLITLPPENGTTAPADPVAKVTPAQPAPEYEFYEVLPKQDFRVEVDPAELPKARSSSVKQFMLQAGSFRQEADADRRRAELLLLGLDPQVESTQGDTGRWFRVVLGPFETRSSMAKARSLTAQQDIDTLLVQRTID